MKIPTNPSWAVLAFMTFGLSACDEPQATHVSPPQVGIVTLQPSARPYVRELPGRTMPTRVAEVRARVVAACRDRRGEKMRFAFTSRERLLRADLLTSATSLQMRRWR